MGISTETGRVKRFICQTTSGRGTVEIKCRFCGGFGWEKGIWEGRVPHKNVVLLHLSIAVSVREHTMAGEKFLLSVQVFFQRFSRAQKNSLLLVDPYKPDRKGQVLPHQFMILIPGDR